MTRSADEVAKSTDNDTEAGHEAGISWKNSLKNCCAEVRLWSWDRLIDFVSRKILRCSYVQLD